MAAGLGTLVGQTPPAMELELSVAERISRRLRLCSAECWKLLQVCGTIACMSKVKRILITGADGAIGKAATKALKAAGHRVVGVDLRPSPLADESLTGTVTDAQFLVDAAKGVDAVIHLAATVNDADFMNELLPNNIVGLFNVLEAARANGVRRVGLASTLQVISGVKRSPGRMISLQDGTSAKNHYAATKIYAEQMGLLYHNRFGMEVVCARIGWLPRDAADAGRLVQFKAQHHYLSHDDAGRFFVNVVEAVGIESATPGYAVVFCISQPATGGDLDMEPAKAAVGYVPRDVFPQGLPFEL